MPASRHYVRREPERTALHDAVRTHLEPYLAERRGRDPERRGVPGFVERALRGYLKCGILAHGFARFRCGSCKAERLVAFSCKDRGICPSCGGRRMTAIAADLVDRVLPRVRHRQWVLSLPHWLRWRLAWDHGLTLAVLRIFVRVIRRFYRTRAKAAGHAGGRIGTVTVVQRFGSALNLNVHFHTLAADGAWTFGPDGAPTFHRARPPSEDEIADLTDLVAARVRRMLVRRGLWIEDQDGGAPAEVDVLPALADVYEASVRGRAGSGERRGRSLRRVGTTMPLEPGTVLADRQRAHGFDLHAGVAVGRAKRERLEHLCRYLLRPPLANDRLERLPQGDFLLTLKRAYSDGTTHLRLSPHELIERLCALIPRPRSNQILYHGLYAPHAKHRASVVPKPPPTPTTTECPAPRRPNHGWAELMRRGLSIDSLECPRSCGGRLAFLACIDQPKIVRRILEHLGLPAEPIRTVPARAPPEQEQWSA